MKKKILPFILVSTLACSCEYDYVRHDTSEYILETPYKDDYKILQLSDIHFGDKDNQKLHMDFMSLTINEASPDIIIVTGDLFTFTSKTTAKTLFEFLDSFDIPWSVTFGNHDEQCYFSVDWLTDYLNNFGSNCLFKDIQDDDVTGNANFAINLTKDNKVFEQLILIDSNRYNYGQYIGYDYIKQDQIDWYERVINYTTKNNNGVVVPSLAFFHIPLVEFEDAYENRDSNNDAIKQEGFSSPKYNSGLFAKMKELGSTKGVFVGHDHVNCFAIEYEGIVLSYGVNSTNRIYFDEDLMGGQVITLHSDHSFEITKILHSYEEVK